MAGPDDHLRLDRADAAGTIHRIGDVREPLIERRLDAAVNNAAILPKGPLRWGHGLFETDFSTWAVVLEVDFFAPALLPRCPAPALRRTHDAVVDVKPIAGSRVHPFARIGYATSKAALASSTREMAADFRPRAARVTMISPSEIDTGILSPGTERTSARIPMRRLGSPEEFAKAICLLCTGQSRYVSGAELMNNGGQHV